MIQSRARQASAERTDISEKVLIKIVMSGFNLEPDKRRQRELIYIKKWKSNILGMKKQGKSIYCCVAPEEVIPADGNTPLNSCHAGWQQDPHRTKSPKGP